MEIAELVKAAREQGWKVERTKKGHWVFYPPNTAFQPIYTSGTPSDWRAIKDLFARLRRAGFQWPWPPQKGARE